MQSHMIGYLTLRKLIGFISFGLPFALIITNNIQNPGIFPGSISSYYYASDICRSILVGALCLISGFLLTYQGYDKDYIPVRISAVFTVGVAFFPTNPINPNYFNNIIGIFHGVFAALMFLSLAYISLFLFPRTKKNKAYNMTRRKKQRNIIYRVCGFIIVGSIVLMPVLTQIQAIDFIKPMFLLETLVLLAFGIAWLVKGQTILIDKKS